MESTSIIEKRRTLWCFWKLLLILCLGEVISECDEAITRKLTPHIVPNAMKYFTGTFADVWVSKHLIDTLNCSFTDIGEAGNITNHVLLKDGRGFSSKGKICEGPNGIINIKVHDYKLHGLIYPIYACHEVIAYFSCYKNVTGPGVSVISVRTSCLHQVDAIRHVYEAKVVFRHLQECGIPVNDGEDY